MKEGQEDEKNHSDVTFCKVLRLFFGDSCLGMLFRMFLLFGTPVGFFIYLFVISVAYTYIPAVLGCIMTITIIIFGLIRVSGAIVPEGGKNGNRACFRYFVILYGICLLGLLAVSSFSFFSVFTMPYHNFEGHAVGALSSNSAMFWIRFKTYKEVAVSYRVNNTEQWHYTNASISNATRDYTALINVTDLNPNTTYEYRIVYYNFPPDPAKTSKVFYFKTLFLPDQAANFQFSSTSCSMKATRLGYQLKGFDSIVEKKPHFGLFLGDLIYADVPMTFGLGPKVEPYFAKYRETYQDKHFQEYARSVPTFYMYDDHEIINDYDGRNTTDIFQAGIKAWDTYAGATNPHFPSHRENGRYYYHFETGKVAFFVMDQHYFFNKYTGTALGYTQLDNFKAWLLEKNSTADFKFIVSAMPWTLNYNDGRKGWGAVRSERDNIMDFIKLNYIKGCIFLSGDAHGLGAFELRPGLLELSASPVAAASSPYNPFDNPIYGTGEDETIFLQPEYTARRDNQYQIINVRTDATPPVVEVSFYSSSDLWLNMSIYTNGTYTKHPLPSE